MGRSGVRRVTLLLLLVALTGVWMLSLTVPAEGQQGANARTKSEVAPSSTQEPGKAGAPEPSVATPPAAKGPGGQPSAKQGEDKGETKKEEPPKPNEPLRYSTEAVIIAGLMIVVLGLLFFLQFSYSHRLEQTTYLGEIYRESVRTFEYSRLAAPHIEKWAKGAYRQEAAENEPPPSLDAPLQELDDKWGDGRLRYRRDRVINQTLGLDPWSRGGGTANPFETGLPGLGENRKPGGNESLPDKNDPDYIKYQQKVLEFDDSLKQWVKKITDNANKAHASDLAQDTKTAGERTETAIDTTEASLLRGQGPRFVLEFTALVVIIFLAVVLGVLGRLGNEQIGTLLAAIAGYVLGKATTGRGGTGDGKPTGKE
jgi:hypothetical protein